MTIAFRLAVAALGVHACVDAFLAPERGTSWRDHEVRGLATLTLLLIGAVVFPRVRAGARALVAGTLGALAIEGSILAIYDARATGPHGEDWTGFALAPVGVALCAIAVSNAWRSRKPGRWRLARRFGVGVATIVFAYTVVVPVAMAIGATHRPRASVPAPTLGKQCERVTLRTQDGLRLAAWYVPSRNGAAIVSFPTRKGKLPQARMLVRHGYGVLLLDARGYDGSEGDTNVFGWGEAKDIDAAVAWLAHRPDVHDSRIGGIGFSVGGEMMLEAAAANRRLRAVVSEGAGYRSVHEVLLYGARGWISVPSTAVQTAALSILSGTPPPPSLRDVVARIAPRPVFFIYAEHGAGGEDLTRTYFRAARTPKLLWRVSGAHHVGGFDAHPREYERRVVRFFDDALLRERR
jgi:uncharacterized protein